MILLRTLEAAGAGVLAAAALSIVLALALLWLDRPALSLCAAAMTIGGVGGAAWACLRRPTLLQAAREADRQLDLDDLLATALLRGDDRDPWQRAVVASAEERCRALRASDVILARFGARAWGGVGLSAALVMTVATLSATPRGSVAHTPGGFAAMMAEQAGRPAAKETAGSPSSVQRQSPAAEERSRVEPERIDDRGTGAIRRASQRSRPGSVPGGTDGSSRTADAGIGELPAPISPLVPASIPKAGAATGGGGRGSGADAAPAQSAGPPGLASGETGRGALWKSDAWQSDCDAAGEAVRDGRVPEAYRDVVREYFKGR